MDILFNKRLSRYILVSLLFVFVCAISLVGFISLKNIESELKKQTLENLASQVKSTQNLIKKGWLDYLYSDINNWSTTYNINNYTQVLLNSPNDAVSLKSNPYQLQLREHFNDSLQYHTKGFFIVSPKNINIASSRDTNLGITNQFFSSKPSLLNRIMKNQQIIIPPTYSDVPLINKQGKLIEAHPTMFIGVPVRDKDGIVIAALLVRIDPSDVFSRIATYIKVGKTGETYFFNKQAVMLSESRFMNELITLGLLKLGQESLLNVEVRIPNLLEKNTTNKIKPPMTLMAASATSGKSDHNPDAYLDYRGIPVYGAWVWDKDLGIGIASEIDESEVLAALDKITFTVIMLILLLTIFGIVTILFIYAIQKKAVINLELSEQNLHAMMANAADAIITIESDGTVNPFNNVARELLGYTSNNVQINSIETFFPSNISPQVKNWMTSQATVEDTFVIFPQILIKNLTGRFINVRISLSHHTQGKRRFYSAVIYDLTELNQMQSRLLQLQSAVDQSSASIMITSLDAKIEYVNKAFNMITGYSSKEVIGKNPVLLQSGLTPDAVYKDMLQTLSEGNSWQGEMYSSKKDGSIHCELSNISPIRNSDGVITSYLEIKEDITLRNQERDQAEKAQSLLHESERIAKLGSWEWDVESDKYAWSEGMFILMGILPTGKDLSFEDFLATVHPEDRFTFLKHRVDTLIKFQPYDIEYRVITGNGQEKAIQVVAEVFRDEKGNPIKLMGVAHDITQQKVIEEEIRQRDKEQNRSRLAALSLMQDANSQKVRAEEAVTELKISQTELQQAKINAEAASDSKSRFLATMSHEIRTPMNGVVGMLELLNQTELSQQQRHLAKVARNSSLALLNIINDILDFSKIEAGKMTVENIHFSWRDIIEDVANILSEQIHSNKLELYCFIHSDLPNQLMGDPTRLRQIALNLLGNAIKFTSGIEGRQGQIFISVEFNLDTKNNKHYLRLCVKDNGIGISEEKEEKLFKAFSQVDDSTHRQFGGTGLGLSISSRLTEMMNGHIGLINQEGEGCEFYIDLPVLPDNSLLVSPTMASKIENLNIHAIDIDDNIIEFMQADLIRLGAHCQKFTFDNQSLKELIPPSVDIIFIDADSQALLNKDVLNILNININPNAPELIIFQKTNHYDEHRYPINAAVINSNPFLSEDVYHAIDIVTGHIDKEDEVSTNNIETSVILPSLQEAEESDYLILIVEDNLTNQEVLERQVNLFGYVARIANHGKEALALMSQHHFSLIITDWHMPQMDGFELTKAIRKQEKDENKTEGIIIVAATANALQGEAESCLEVGMNDYISKPIKLTEMKAILAKWLPITALPIDTAVLVQYMGDDVAVHKKFLQNFAKLSQSTITQLKSEFEIANIKSMTDIAHKLKSSSRTIGATALADLCESLEQAGKIGNEALIASTMPLLLKEFDSACQFIEDKMQ